MNVAHMSRTGRSSLRLLAVLLGVLAFAAGVVALGLHGPIPQDPVYHQFADSRPLLGVPNAGDVLTNALFCIAGALGLLWMARLPRGVAGPLSVADKVCWTIFFAFVLLTGIGSAYYHWTPNNQTLVWDRMPLTVAFMSLVCAVIGDRFSPRLAGSLLVPMCLIGAGSIVYWDMTERAGSGDLRPYAIVQFGSLLAIMVMAVARPPRYLMHGAIWGGLAFYIAAKGAEHWDRAIYDAWPALGLGVRPFSGHTLKHVLAAMAPVWLLWRVRSAVLHLPRDAR